MFGVGKRIAFAMRVPLASIRPTLQAPGGEY